MTHSINQCMINGLKKNSTDSDCCLCHNETNSICWERPQDVADDSGVLECNLHLWLFKTYSSFQNIIFLAKLIPLFWFKSAKLRHMHVSWDRTDQSTAEESVGFYQIVQPCSFFKRKLGSASDLLRVTAGRCLPQPCGGRPALRRLGYICIRHNVSAPSFCCVISAAM